MLVPQVWFRWVSPPARVVEAVVQELLLPVQTVEPWVKVWVLAWVRVFSPEVGAVALAAVAPLPSAVRSV